MLTSRDDLALELTIVVIRLLCQYFNMEGAGAHGTAAIHEDLYIVKELMKKEEIFSSVVTGKVPILL